MTREEKLTKIIEKAEKNGFDLWNWTDNEFYMYPSFKSEERKNFVIKYLIYGFNKNCVKLLLVDHDFAKAYWGEDSYKVIGYEADFPPEENKSYQYLGCYILKWNKTNEPSVGFKEIEIPLWQYNLQQAIISNDILEYYFEH